MEEKKENEFVEGKQLKVIGIETQVNEKNQIIKATFKTDQEFNITWKPKVTKEEFISGIKKIYRETMTIEEMPEKLKEMGEKCLAEGSVNMKVNYFIFEKEVEGEIKKYRFITSQKTFDKWEIL